MVTFATLIKCNNQKDQQMLRVITPFLRFIQCICDIDFVAFDLE